MNHIKYNDKWFNYYSSAKYTGKSILTGKNINIGDAIYWCVGVGGFLASEIELINNTNNTNNIMYHRGSVNFNWTYDDSFSRQYACQIFKKEYNIELKDHLGIFIKDDNTNYLEYTNGKYCEDLISVNNDKITLVEVERSNNNNMFDKNNLDNINILVSKYWKYFDDGNKNHEHYMCFINEECGKACIISGKDIKFNRGKYKQVIMKDGKVKEYYEIPKKYAKIYDLDNSIENTLKMCEVTYP